MDGHVMRREEEHVEGLRAGEERDGAYWRARIYNHTGDPRWREKPETKKITGWILALNDNTILENYNTILTSLFYYFQLDIIGK